MDTQQKSDDLDLDLINDLAARFSFEVDDLKGKLSVLQIMMIFYGSGITNIPTAKERHRHLDSVKKAALNLAEKMEKLPISTRFEIEGELTKNHELVQAFSHYAGSESAGDDYYPLNLGMAIYYSLHYSLFTLANVAHTVHGRHQPRKEDQYKIQRDHVIIHVAEAWKNMSGRAATYTTNWSTSKRGGDFISFLVSIAEIIGIDPDPLPERFRRLKEEGRI